MNFLGSVNSRDDFTIWRKVFPHYFIKFGILDGLSNHPSNNGNRDFFKLLLVATTV